MINTVRTAVFDTANKFDIQIGYSGHVITGPEWNRRDDSLPFSKLYYIIDGCAQIVYRGEKIALVPGNVYFIPYDLPHGLLCEQKLEKLYFHFTLTDSIGCDLLDGIEGVHSMPIPIQKILELKEMYYANDLQSWLLLKLQVTAAAAQFIGRTGISHGDYDRYSDKIRQAMRYINSNLSVSLAIDEVAKNIFISPSTLSKRFLRETGQSIGKYIDKQVMLRARQLLVSSDVSLRSVSEMLGFCDQFYFTRKFRSFYRCTPTEYRLHHRKI